MFKNLNHSHLESVMNVIQCHAIKICEYAYFELLQDTNLRELENNETQKIHLQSNVHNYIFFSFNFQYFSLENFYLEIDPQLHPTKTDISFTI
jgi:hypothetical protein